MAKRKRPAVSQLVVESNQPPAAPPKDTGAPLAAIVLLIVIAAAALIRMRLMDLPLERDEGEYAYAGQLMLDGVPPYTLAYNMKFPGTYAAYALMMSVFGQTPSAIRLGLILLTSATTLLVYLLGTKLFGRMAGVIAAAAYALLSLSLQSMGPFGHATHFVTFFAVAGALAILLGGPPVAGALVALAILMKQPAFPFAIFGAVWYASKRRWRDLALFTAGGTGVAILAAIALAAAGVFSQFKHWTIDYAREYASALPLSEAIEQFRINAGAIFWASPLLWLIVAAGAVLIVMERSWFAIGFTLASFAAVVPGLYFRAHYFLVAFPAAAILCGAAVAILARRMPAAVPLVAFVAAAVAALGAQWQWLVGAEPLQMMRVLYRENPFVEAPAVADYLRDHTTVADRIAILGSEPEIYFYAHRKSATGYIYAYPLMEQQRFAHSMQLDMIRGIEEAKPKYLVMVSHTYSWLAKTDSDRTIFDWYTKTAMSGAYTLEAQVDDGNWITGAEALSYRPRTKNVIAIWRRAGAT